MKRRALAAGTIGVQRTKIRLEPDQCRVVLRPLWLGSHEEYIRVIDRALDLQEMEVRHILDRVLADFTSRHRRLDERLLARYAKLEHLVLRGDRLSRERKLLIGSYFMYEYAAESAALFNPSILPHPDQSGIAPGSLR